jgi:hypothetical protein
MGRQIQVVATAADESAFLAFLRESAEIAIIDTFTRTRDALWVDEFNPELIGHWIYKIWNKAYPWQPEYRQTDKAENPNNNGLFYVSNTDIAPVIEFTRSDVPRGKCGRIYWGKDFSAPHGLDYDTDAFGKWFDKVVRWVRKNGRKDQNNVYSPYYLPGAWQMYMDAQQSG